MEKTTIDLATEAMSMMSVLQFFERNEGRPVCLELWQEFKKEFFSEYLQTEQILIGGSDHEIER